MPSKTEEIAEEMDIDLDLDTTTDEILLAATNHDLPTLRRLLVSPGSASVRDTDTGYTPLHCAIASCEADDDLPPGDHDAITSTALSEEGCVATVKLLLENGAIWNDLDLSGETPGCMALRLKLKEVYELLVEAGVRAELLLNRLDGFAVLAGSDSEAEDDEDEEIPEEARVADEQAPQQDPAQDPSQDPAVESARYLASDLSFSGDRVLDGDGNGVMMSWETALMSRSASLLLADRDPSDLRILNIGHGMGIIDSLLAEKGPLKAHHIVEAHPAVLEKMRAEGGWTSRKGVTVHEGRWQDVLPGLAAEGTAFDVIYFDTFAEDYSALKEFFTEHVIALMAPEGRFGFFNGLGADRQVCYDVYTRVVEMDLFEAGLDTQWEEVKIEDLDASGEWEGVRRKYWALDTYRLPTCTFVG